MTLKIKAIHHVNVRVPPELEEVSIAFYRDLLGLTQIDKPEPLNSRGGAWFTIGASELHLSVESATEGNPSKRHVCYEVENLGEARDYLWKQGLVITDEATDPNGLKRFFITDPAGNRIEIAESP